MLLRTNLQERTQPIGLSGKPQKKEQKKAASEANQASLEAIYAHLQTRVYHSETSTNF